MWIVWKYFRVIIGNFFGLLYKKKYIDINNKISVNFDVGCI